MAAQKALGYRTTPLLPYDRYTRKTVGYLFAIEVRTLHNSKKYMFSSMLGASCNSSPRYITVSSAHYSTAENIDRNMFFSLKKDSRTRGHEVKLVKDQCRLDIRKHSFSQRTINEWNKLSTDCVTASSVNMFKNKVDTYLRSAGYQ